jgi:hypothetical protein
MIATRSPTCSTCEEMRRDEDGRAGIARTQQLPYLLRFAAVHLHDRHELRLLTPDSSSALGSSGDRPIHGGAQSHNTDLRDARNSCVAVWTVRHSLRGSSVSMTLSYAWLVVALASPNRDGVGRARPTSGPYEYLHDREEHDDEYERPEQPRWRDVVAPQQDDGTEHPDSDPQPAGVDRGPPAGTADPARRTHRSRCSPGHRIA